MRKALFLRSIVHSALVASSHALQSLQAGREKSAVCLSVLLPPLWYTSTSFLSAKAFVKNVKPTTPKSKVQQPEEQKESTHKINQGISAKELRVVFPDNTTKILPRGEALHAAKELSLDLVEVAPLAEPPVARIVKYLDFSNQQKPKAEDPKQDKKIKEMHFSTKIDDHDLEVRVRRTIDFLEHGKRVWIFAEFKEEKQKNDASLALDYVLSRLKDVSKVDRNKHQHGRAFCAIVKPLEETEAVKIEATS